MKIKPMLGDFALDDIEYIESSESRALVEHRVPGLAGNYFQDMGSVPNTILIAGSKSGDEARDNFLSGIREIFNKGEQTTFVADINTATDITDVVIQDLQVAEIGGEASGFRYLVKLRKYVKPPEPPSTDLLDTSILDDALNVMDALDALDALGSIPNLGDPTPPLKEALGGIQAATSGMPEIVGQVQNITQALPSSQPPTDILAPILGDEASGTGVAGVLKLLEQVDTANISVSVTANLDQSVSAKVSVDTSALTGGTLEQFKQALGALPNDPTTLTLPISANLEDIKRLSSTELSNQLLSGISGLKDIRSLMPADAGSLIDEVANRMSQVKGELIRGEFGQIIEWSESVKALYAEIAPLIESGSGTVEDRLLAYLREKINALVGLILPEGDLALALSGRLDGSISADLLPQINSLKNDLIAHFNLARIEFESGNFTNTMHLGNAQLAFQRLMDLLASITAKLRPILDQDFITPQGLTAKLQKQFDAFDEIEIIDLGNIKDKFASAIKRIEDLINGIDLSSVRKTIDGVFAKLDGAIGQLDLRKFTSKLSGLKDKLQSALDAIDGALFEAVASIRNVFAKIKDALRSVASALGSYDDEGKFHFHVQEQIEDFLNGIKTTIHDTIQPLLDQLKNTVGQILKQVQDGLNAVKGEIEKVKGQLESSLQGIHTQLQSVDVQGTMESVGASLKQMLDQLGTVDFDLVADPVIAQINEMRDALKKINISSLNEFTIGALKVSVVVVVKIDFTAQITGVLMAEIDKILEIPKNALAEIEGKVEGAIKQFAELAPAALLRPLDDLFKPITAHLDALKLETLLKPLDDWYARLQAELDKVSPAALLKPLIDLYAQLEKAFQAVSPSELVHPLQEAIDGIKAEIHQIDLTGVASELGGAIEQIKKALDEISPAQLLNPLVKGFDKIMGALDQFDPGILLKPFSDIFDAVAKLLVNLTGDHLRLIGEVFATLRAVVEAFDPRRIFQLVREKLAAVQTIVQQINLGGLIASLKTPYDAMHGSFEAHGGPANISVSASVEGLNPLRNASLGQAVADFQYCQAKLSGLLQAQPPAELVARYDKMKSLLESLVPLWAKENISAASVRRAFEVANPLNLKAEIDQLYEAFKQKLRTFDPRVIQEHLQASFDKFKDAVFALDPKVILGEVQSVIDALTARLEIVNLKLITDELQGVVDEIKGVINGLDPKPIIAKLQGLVDEVKGVVDALQPSKALAELQAPFEISKAIVAEFNPAALTEPLQAIFKDIQAILEAIDVGVVLEPLADKLKQQRDALEQALSRTETAFNGMIKAIPV
jgi:phage-related protein